ncbi:MAG: sporulation protein YqfD [Clostridia bacterium]|nr:sporulation protein YqfD [Clostridia bacterium]
MFIIELIRWLFGYINFRAFEGFPDRFINLCTKNEVPLWNIKNVGGRLSASTTIQGYLNIRECAKKSGMKVRVVEKKGLIFFLKKHKKRVGIAIGIAICILLFTILSQFVWNISVVGNDTLETEFILSAFEDYGIKVGKRITKEQMQDAAEKAVIDIEKLSWATINQKGTVLVIEVREKVDAPEMYDNSKPTNVIAKEDGLILSLDILYGNAEAKIGSAVTKGDLLISGIAKHPDGSESLIHADGHIKALVKKRNISNASSFNCYNLITENKRKSLFFFGAKIPFGKKVPNSFYSLHNSFLESDEMLLPLGIITEYGAEYSSEKCELSENLQNKIALYDNALFVRELLDYCDIKTSSVTAKTTEYGQEYSFFAECEQEIGVLQEIYVEKTNDIA